MKKKLSDSLKAKKIIKIFSFLLIPFGFALPALLPYLIIIFLFVHIIFPPQKTKFIRLQASLPTSKARSVAMGLAEIEGKLVLHEPLMSPIDQKPCIGYRYEIQTVHREKGGKTHHHTISEKMECNHFSIEDETGRIKVIPEEMEWVWIPEENSVFDDEGKRHVQYLLKEGDKMLIVGNVTLNEQEPTITKHPLKKVFWNNSK